MNISDSNSSSGTKVEFTFTFTLAPVDLEDDSLGPLKTAHDLLTECEAASNISDLNTAIYLLQCIAHNWQSGHPNLRLCWHHLATALLTRFNYTADTRDVGVAMAARTLSVGVKTSINIEQMFLGMDLSVEDDPDEMLLFACSILRNFHAAPDAALLETAITLYQEGLAQQEQSYSRRWSHLGELSRALLISYHLTGDFEKVNEAITYLQEVQKLKPNRTIWLCAALITGKTWYLSETSRLMFEMSRNDEKAGQLSQSGEEFAEAFQDSGNLKDISKAVSKYKEAEHLLAVGHPYRANLLERLANVLLKQYNSTANQKDLQQAIEVQCEGLTLCTPSDPIFNASMVNWVNSLSIRHDLRIGSKLVEDTDENYNTRSVALENLRDTFQSQLDKRGNLDEIYKLVESYEKDLALQASSHPSRPFSLRRLARILEVRWNEKNDPIDIDKAVDLHTEALALCPSSHPARMIWLSDLGLELLTKFEQRGDLDDLERAIGAWREALALCPQSHPRYQRCLNDLGQALSIRYNETRDTKDVDEAIILSKNALSLYTAQDKKRGMLLNNLANALTAGFVQSKDLEDITDAIKLYEEALSLFDLLDPERSIPLVNLASAHKERWEKTQAPAEIDMAIELLQQALPLCPQPHPNHTKLLSNLAVVFQTRFLQRRTFEDLDEAITLNREVLALRPPPHAYRSLSLVNLGACLIEQTSNPLSMNEAMSVFRQASTYSCVSPFMRLIAASHWGRFAVEHSDSSSLEAYQTVIALLPQIAAFHLSLATRQRMLTAKEITVVASSAATFAIGQKQYNTAIEFLEATRSVFWAQALHLRAPLNQLQGVSPHLAYTLQTLSSSLEQASFRDTSQNISDSQKKILSMEAEGARYRRLNEEWDQTIDAVRSLPGFKDFLRPVTIMALRKAAVTGSVIVLIPGTSTSFALIVTQSKDVQCVHLPEMDPLRAQFMAQFSQALSKSAFNIDDFLESNRQLLDIADQKELQSRLNGGREQIVKMNENDTWKVFLEEIWSRIVKPVFEQLNLKKSSQPPRVWWCPTGSFAFLPLHAAGIYQPASTDCVTDYVISSYTPTLTALLDPPLVDPSSFKITAVVEPSAPNCSPLPGVEDELARIMDHVPNDWISPLCNTKGTTVLDHLKDSSIVHFACHGTQNLNNPLDSGLMLTEGLLKVAQIMQGPENNERATKKFMSLAFLSACETAKGDVKTPDEALHLAATLLFAGFRGVVATMWTIQDQDGPKVADIFYGHLFKVCDANSSLPVFPKLTGAAEALHIAVAKLREEPDISFKRWVPFVHYGL
ncbi:CHAT domain-containing protein [Mycena venus]|uniref:CHAT domain-containing protein n=1 Tax=Mycena venus TaxID=2733690 RepID=A0A8H6XN37_9AGAR|nr:CHAT domain-containing protein [Mycena venus]